MAYLHTERADNKIGPVPMLQVGTDNWFSVVEKNLPEFKKGELIVHHECPVCAEYSVVKEDAEYGVTVDVYGHVDSWVIPTEREIAWEENVVRPRIMEALSI